jgi:hypothetical protein
MANTIIIKNSSTISAVPLVGDLILGELAVNTYDGKVYMKKDDGAEAIIEIGGGITAVVEDINPVLGGDLDVNGNSIGDGTLELLSFSETASAVNEFTIANAATTNGPTLSATGDDTDIDIIITSKGTGRTVITNLEAPTTQQTEIGLTYDPVLADADKMITMNNGAANTVTIPANGSVAYPVGTKLNFMQLGAGKTTIAITTDTLDSKGALFSLSQYGVATAMKITSIQWVLYGDDLIA